METRSRKSRSRTPFMVNELSEEFLENETIVENKVRITRSSNTVKVKEHKSSSIDEVTSSNLKPIKKSMSQYSGNWYRTSDYSSEDGDNEVSSTKSITQNEKNQILEDAKAAANGSSQVSALDLYKKSGRYWDLYPKTDFTYSPYSRDRVEIAPGVVAMPNMSRRTIHSVTNSSSEDSQMTTSVEHKNINTVESYLVRNYDDNYLPRKLFNNNNDTYYTAINRKVIIKKKWSRIKEITANIVTMVLSIVYFCFRVQTSWFTRLHKLTSNVMLMDTWLLWKNYGGNKTKRLMMLCFVPLVLFGGWWLWFNRDGWSIDKSESHNFIDDPIQVPEVPSDVPIERVLPDDMFINQQKTIDKLREEMTKLRSEMLEAEKNRRSDLDRILLDANEGKTVYVTQRIKRCCQNPLTNLEAYVNRVVGTLLNDPEFLRNQKGFNEYMRAVFAAREELEYTVGNLTLSLNEKYVDMINDSSAKLMEEVAGRLIVKESSVASGNEEVVSDGRIKKIVKSVLSVYDADKTGLVDYAMESMGAQILSTRCTENYHYGKAVVSVLGIPLWYPVNSPRSLITPGINPGQCWAFQNFPGFVMIRLSKRIEIDAFSLEHINRLSVPNGDIDSAPKQFEVYGLKDENDKEPILLGEYVYDYNGEPLQFFEVQNKRHIFEIVELRVVSNHGNPNYTCLYRFRVHGKSVSS